VFAALADATSIGVLLASVHRRRVGKFRGAIFLPALAAAFLAWPCFLLSVVVGGSVNVLVGGYGDLAGIAKWPLVVSASVLLGMWLAFVLSEALVVISTGLAVLGPRRP